MITTKELQYVTLFANRIPMPGIEYSLETLEYMKRCLEQFDKMYRNKSYNIIFSNGDEIDLQIQEKNLCHLLGIDYKNVRGDYFHYYRRDVLGLSYDNFTSFELLEGILENAERIAEKDNDPNNYKKLINYYKVRIKCEIFSKLCDFSNFNYGAIDIDSNAEYLDDSDEESNDENRFETEKIQKYKGIYVPSNESVCPYFMMRIKQDINNVFVPISTIALQYPKAFFDNKEATIPTQILITDGNNLTKKVAEPDEKIKLLTLYKSIINEYQIPNRMNIYGDYESMLNELNTKTNILKRER